MWPFGIVPVKVAPEIRFEFRAGFRWPQIDVLILDGTPEPLHEYVVGSSTFQVGKAL